MSLANHDLFDGDLQEIVDRLRDLDRQLRDAEGRGGTLVASGGALRRLVDDCLCLVAELAGREANYRLHALRRERERLALHAQIERLIRSPHASAGSAPPPDDPSTTCDER